MIREQVDRYDESDIDWMSWEINSEKLFQYIDTRIDNLKYVAYTMSGAIDVIPKEQRSILISNLWEDSFWEEESKFHQVPTNHYFMLRKESENMRGHKTQKQERGRKWLKLLLLVVSFLFTLFM